MSEIGTYRLARPDIAVLVDALPDQKWTGYPGGQKITLHSKLITTALFAEGDTGQPALRFPVQRTSNAPFGFDDRLRPVNPDGGDMGRGTCFRLWEHPAHDGSIGYLAFEGPKEIIDKIAALVDRPLRFDGQTVFPVYGASGGIAATALCYCLVHPEDVTFSTEPTA